ncbi:MAG: SDR family oxidoreductase [Bauldia sp.]|nr:SDR family oxidoreductase [Bauldia sp.]
MRVLLTGASGLIGSAVRARLEADGHSVVAVVRRARGAEGEVAVDLARATEASAWTPHLEGVEAVVNCAGVLQDGPGESTERVHLAAVAALAAACEAGGVRRFIQVSALGAERDLTAFARTKHAAESALAATGLDWVVLRPAVVVGRAAYGGSALFRGLAALPVLPEVRGTAGLQIVQLDDLVAAVAFFLKEDAPARLVLDMVGPQRLSVTEVVQHYRRWLRLRPARTLPVPGWLWRAICFGGDLVRWFGWRAPLNSTLARELAAEATGDVEALTRVTGIVPRSLGQALAAEPASVQERWFSRLYLLKPIVLGVLALFWATSGLIGVGPGLWQAEALLRVAGFDDFAVPAAIAAGLLDVAVGVGILFRRSAWGALVLGFWVSILYLAGGTVLLPSLWADPLGPFVKVLPILALHAIALATLPDR